MSPCPISASHPIIQRVPIYPCMVTSWPPHYGHMSHHALMSALSGTWWRSGDAMHPGKVTMQHDASRSQSCKSEDDLRKHSVPSGCFDVSEGRGSGARIYQPIPCRYLLQWANEKRSMLEGGAGQGAMHQRSTRHIRCLRCLPNSQHLRSWIFTRHSLFLPISWAQNKTSDTSASLSGPSTWLNTFHVQLLTWNLEFRIIWCLTNEGKYFSLSPTLRFSSFSCQNLCFYFPSSSCEFSSAAWQVNTEYNQAVTDKSHVSQIFTSRLPSQQYVDKPGSKFAVSPHKPNSNWGLGLGCP